MRAKNSLLALLVPAGLVLAATGHADGRFQTGARAGTPVPYTVNAHDYHRAHAPAPAPRPARAAYPHREVYPAQGYWAWDGYRYVWVGVPLVAPGPYHVPVFNRQGWLVDWNDMSGDVPDRDVELLRWNYRSQRD